MSVTKTSSFPYKKLSLLAGLILLGVVLWYFSTIVVYIILALLLSLLGRPIMNLLKKIRIFSWTPGNSLLAGVTLILLCILIGGAIYLIMPAVVNMFTNISSYSGGELGNIIRYPFKDLETAINNSYPGTSISFNKMISKQLEPLLSLDLVKNTVGHIVTMAVDISVGIFCVLFITFFFLQDSGMFSKWVKSLVPDEYLSQVLHAMDSIYALQVRYIVGITAESILKFVVLFIAFWIFGLHADTAAVASLFCAVLNPVPYVGPIIGGAIAVVLGVLSMPYGVDVDELMVAMLVALVIFQIIDNILLQPYIYGSSVKAHPLEIFIVILMAGSIAGVMGMLLAIPTYTILRVFAKEFLGKFKLVRELTTNI